MTAVAAAEMSVFLGAPTPPAWVEAALQSVDLLIVDHANCEKKAAASALALINRYGDRDELVLRMSRLAREELRHFEQVRKLMDRLGYGWRQVSAARYGGALRAAAGSGEPGRLVDLLLIGAFIEARSCERFALLAPRLAEPMSSFYRRAAGQRSPTLPALSGAGAELPPFAVGDRDRTARGHPARS